MSATYQSERASDPTLHRNGSTTQLAAVCADTQIHRSPLDYDRLVRIGRDLLEAIGEDVTRPGITETPRRFADWWREFIDYDAGRVETTFEAVTTNQMVVVSGMRVWSVCEHHLIPFWCDISVGYIARDKVLGLSKFARIAHKHAHRPQIQERLVDQIASEIQLVTGSEDVAVLATGEHLCMTMRGIKTPAVMKSSVMRGAFYWNQSARSEFLQLVNS